MEGITFSVFTKHWKTTPIDELGKFLAGMGFGGVELPVRPGFQAQPESAEKDLPEIAERLKQYGVKVASVAAPLDENIFAGCAAAGIPMIRIMVPMGPGGYYATVNKAKDDLRRAMPLCEKYGVKIGVQQHFGEFVSSTMEMLRVVEEFDPKYIGAVWDSVHSGFAGEEPELALEMIWENLLMVNLKAGFYRRVNGPEAYEAKWEQYLTTARHGLSSWSRAAEYLKKNNYTGVVTLGAEYSEEDKTDIYIAQEIAYAKELFG